MATIIRLLSQEGEIIEVDQDTVSLSVLIKSMIDDSGPEEDIPLPNVTKPILEKVIEFCKHVKDYPLQEIEKPLKSDNLRDIVSAWYADYVELEQEVLFEVILAANYLDIRPLLELSCAKVATMIKGKSVVEVRKLFNIENDFTPEEEAQILEENKWAEEAI
uniref:S-phase kinase-associated protein 1 n=1 Tax=Euplotes harpa TaxID=151035 RepID=A0A7S3JFI0_9SPIT